MHFIVPIRVCVPSTLDFARTKPVYVQKQKGGIRRVAMESECLETT